MLDQEISGCPTRAFINGQWVTALAGKEFAVYDPATLREIARVPDMGTEETRDAITVAETALQGWKTTLVKERSRILYRWYHLIVENADRLARILTAEQGKPLSEAKAEVLSGAEFVLWAAEEAKRLYGDYIPAHKPDTRIIVSKEPVGVVAAITPWNFPSAMITRKVPMALAAGCTVILKPAEDTPLSALVLAELAQEAGLPDGVFNIVTGSLENAPKIGAVLCEDPRVRKISFTGSTEVGRWLMEKSSRNIKKLALELGGNAPFIVFDSADLDEAVQGLVACKLRNGGQTCVCANRIFVQEGIYDAFASRFTEALENLKLGRGEDNGIDIGPMINDQGRNKVERLIDDAVQKGATVSLGGTRAELQDNEGNALNGAFFKPTVLINAQEDMACYREEIFGPVAPLYKFKTEDDVIQKANDTEYGLAAYLYSSDQAQIWRVSDALDYGMVAANEPLLATEFAPFGGIKQSGLGREGSKYGILEFTNVKYRLLGKA